MYLSKAASALSFFLAFTIGSSAAYVVAPLGGDVADVRFDKVPVQVEYVEPPVTRFESVPVRIESLIGVWRGRWGYDRENCTIEIDRIAADKFHGTLRKEGAVIAIVGTLDAERRTVFFHETKVLKLGPEMSEWSLGTNFGSFSPDGRALSGSGTDQWGSYEWAASKK